MCRTTLREGDPPSRFVARFLRFKWATLSASVVFLAFTRLIYGSLSTDFGGKSGLGDNFLVALLFLVLLIVQQLKQERELRRHAEMTSIIADMNHPTRNALQVIVDKAYEKKTVQEREALDEIPSVRVCSRQVRHDSEISVLQTALKISSLLPAAHGNIRSSLKDLRPCK
jgi:hypothetical protein